ncbi:MAG: type I-C CRISPR-associated endonuclease Cas1c [Firmicutes bacterium]|jgi:CRISPR-associated protein Cas1|nr:type I-C CRISPR-associated endonuclease Cas1c [Bacillota bacterium]MDH7495878.1 type I-C CRISPR-associated endonuclease Cas1c [Bacillota bacterium]
MRKLLNTLYVTTPHAYLSRDGENLVATVDDQERFRVPIHNLEGIVCFNYAGTSPSLMSLCCERGVSLCYLSESGRFLARVSGRVSGNVLLRRKQYRLADADAETAGLAKAFVSGKVLNCRSVLMRFARDHDEKEGSQEVAEAAERLLVYFRALDRSLSADAIRGIEGDAARAYYEVFRHLITEQKESFAFRGRSRRPPLDPMNALLSFLYTLLMMDCASALETVGLDPQVGFLHRDRPGRLSLALDLMEELRPYLVDRLALTLVNNKQVSPNGFVKKESGGVLMDADTRKLVLTEWQKRKQEEITHPFLEEKISIGLIPYVQSLLLARHLRGDLDGYPPFLVR